MKLQLANINGVVTEAKDAKISIFDRGFLYGDSLYEVVRTYHGRPSFMKEHLRRLRESDRLAYFELSDEKYRHFEDEMNRTIRMFYEMLNQGPSRAQALQPDLYVRIIVTRGQGRIGFSRKAIESGPNMVILCEEAPMPNPKVLQEGLKLKLGIDRIRNSPKALTPAMKSGNYLNCVLAYLEAENEEYDDALLVDHEGFVTEGTTFNVFYVKNNTLVTSPFDIGILDGITRKYVLKIAEKMGLSTQIARFTADKLYEADEVFITGTIREVCPVTQINGHVIGQDLESNASKSNQNNTRRAGPITQKLLQAYREFASTEGLKL